MQGLAGLLLIYAGPTFAQIKFVVNPANQPGDSVSAETMRLYSAMNRRLAANTEEPASSCFKTYAVYQDCKANVASAGCGAAPACSIKGKLSAEGSSGVMFEFIGDGDTAMLVPHGVEIVSPLATPVSTVAAPSTPASQPVQITVIHEDPFAARCGRPSYAHVSGAVMAANRTDHDQPDYPMAAKMRGLSGSVVLCAAITLAGRVADLEVVNATNAVFVYSAIDAVRRWRYKPYVLNGAAQEIETTIIVNFVMPPKTDLRNTAPTNLGGPRH